MWSGGRSVTMKFRCSQINVINRESRPTDDRSINNALSVIIQRSNAQMLINRFVNYSEMLPHPNRDNNM